MTSAECGEAKYLSRNEARVVARAKEKESGIASRVVEHEDHFHVRDLLVPNFHKGDRVHLKEAPDIVGIVRKDAIGEEKVVAVYWGTADGREFIGPVPSRLLEHDERPFKTNYS